MTTISPGQFQGARALSKQELLQRAKAVNCTIAKSSKPSCSGQLDVGIYFDGTGNNMVDDFDNRAPQARKHSNVVKLYRAQNKIARLGQFAIYVPGVGTPFPKVDDAFGSIAGGPFAWNSESRIIWAITQLINVPKLFVLGEFMFDEDFAAEVARSLSASYVPAAVRRFNLRCSLSELQAALKDTLLRAEQINLNVYGFTHGAAEARVFCNWLFELCEQERGACDDERDPSKWREAVGIVRATTQVRPAFLRSISTRVAVSRCWSQAGCRATLIIRIPPRPDNHSVTSPAYSPYPSQAEVGQLSRF